MVLRIMNLMLATLFVAACDEGGSPAAPAVTTYSGVYHVQGTVLPHSCPPTVPAPVRGTKFQRTILLEDRRPEMNAFFAGIRVTGAIGVSGSFNGRDAPDPVTTLLLDGRVSTLSGSLGQQMSGEATHRVYDGLLSVACEWAEEFEGLRTSDLDGPLPPS